MSSTALPPLELTGQVKFPKEGDALRDYVARWSDSHVRLPAVVVVPETKLDVITSVQYAQTNGLRVIPAGGGHAPFVPITAKSLYLDMRHFNTIALDRAASTVTVGGGALTGAVQQSLLGDGYYTNLSNSTAVGVVGGLLGSGNGPFNSLHSLVADNVERLRIVTASTDGVVARDVSYASADGDERALFNALCGAGHGLGVIVSLTLRAYKLADLHLDRGDKIWQRRAIFSGSAVRDAARAFVSMLPLKGPVTTTLVFARSPPGTPSPGSPVVILSATHFGPSIEAKETTVAKTLLDAGLAAKAIKTATDSVPVAQINDSTAPYNTPGGYKLLDGTFLHSIDEDTAVSLYDRYVAFTEGQPDRALSYLILASWDTTKAVENGTTPERKDNFFVTRDFNVITLLSAWSHSTGDAIEAESKQYAAGIKDLLKQGQPTPPLSFANNLAFPANMPDYYPQNKLDELYRLKKRWDPSSLFWSPAMGAQ